ncbi:MAG: NTP transferase domain-containing protein [Chloroflexi bacterium]|nr:NTP transferase domain-containing protein [Chloroflexota bacterium]
MSSRRFPGKVLAPFRGEPIILHVVRRARALRGIAETVVLTSDQPSDDPLAAYCEHAGIPLRRGPLDDVLARFRAFATGSPHAWLLRLSADSPLLDGDVLQRLIDHPDRELADIVTTIFPRTFPRGQNGELIRAASLLSLPQPELSASDREHVTPWFYAHPERYRILNVASSEPSLAERTMAVDTVEDLQRLEGRP